MKMTIGHSMIVVILMGTSLMNGQSLSGHVYENNNDPLPYATIQILNSDQGAVSNQDGYFQINLKEGTYTLRFQYVGYRTKDTTININRENNRPLNVRIVHESFTLPTVTVNATDEDPAYTIMRRAIGKASYHANQIDEYRARVYIKGSGRLLKVPFLFRNKIKKELAKEGIDSTVAFAQESVSKLFYKRPGQYRDTVISMRSTGDDNNTSPNSFVYSSFYDPKVAGAISPLAPNAFQIYKFEYLGYIEDHGVIINKIKVTPRGRGDQVFEGLLYITDQVWSIHSLDLLTSIWGIQFSIKQIFSPVEETVWMPIDQIYDVNGNVFGFGFSYKYLAHLSEYRIKLNPDINVPLVILDDKKDKEQAEIANKKINSKTNPLDISGLNSGQELSAKQLRKMMKEYKAKELEAMPDKDTLTIKFSESNQVIDSMASHRDSTYWDEIRPVALTVHEIKGYSRMDSLSKTEKEKTKKDSTTVTINLGDEDNSININKVSTGFRLKHLFTGALYNFEKNKYYFKILPTLLTLNFNTVDGLHGSLGVETGNRPEKDKSFEWKFKPEVLYAFAREAINYRGKLTLQNLTTKNKHLPWALNFEGGRYRFGFNPYLSSNSYLNTSYSLLFKKNYSKLFEKTYFKSSLGITPSKAISLSASAEWADRSPLVNNTNFSFFHKKRTYTSNTPYNTALSSISLSSNEAFITEVSIKWTPFYKYKLENGYKSKDRSVSPEFNLSYKRGWSIADAEFDFLKLDIKHHIHIGAGDDFDYTASLGTFPVKATYFQDYAHFPGNRFAFSPLDPSKSFRLLDYYAYSTNQSFISFLGNYQFRRLLFTTSPWVRKKGIRENIIINSLNTRTHPMYNELGYSINYIFRVFRIEAITAWDKFKYKEFGIRVGVATGLQNLFKF
ncbi:MAG: DUF5686 and carboxypeptidase regulatory-like domain-containing protein [Saprospiraceae bacterium]